MAPNSVELLALAADGKSLSILNALTGELSPFWRDESIEITSIAIFKDGVVLFGTFDGRIFRMSKAASSVTQINSTAVDCPVLFIESAECFVDSAGRLHWHSKIVLDDGVLQPCGLFHSKSTSSLLLVKHGTIYSFNTADSSLKTVKLDAGSVFCAATLLNDETLFASTDSGDHFTFDLTEGSLKRISTELPESDDSDSEESDSEIFIESKISSVKSERIFAVLPNQNDALVLKVDSTLKRAWIETIKLPNNRAIVDDKQGKVPIEFEKVQIICPLCADSRSQSLPLNSSKCSEGHPLTICSIEKGPCRDVSVFRCRECNAAYSSIPSGACGFCNSLLTK